MKLYILIGLPGSGKSTYAKKLEEEGAVVHSSDEIRLDLFGSYKTTNDRQVFKELRKRIVVSLKEGKDVVCDATNVTQSKRSSFLNEIHDIDCEKIAIIVNRDVKTCLAQNKLRPKEKQVPAVAIYTSAKSFVYPTFEEGFDIIKEV